MEDPGGAVKGSCNPSKGCGPPKLRRDDPAFLFATSDPSVLFLDFCSTRHGRAPHAALPPFVSTPLTFAVLDFLRLSRSAIDDTISQNLNALETPARAGFDPASTSRLGPRPLSHQIDATSCRAFKDQVLFPSWQARSDLLSYCALVATSPDADDPEIALREAENEKNRERVVDERLDPYSARFFPREARTERLANVIRLEMGVENIVRSRTWDIVRQRCSDPSYDAWEEALAAWRRSRASPERR